MLMLLVDIVGDEGVIGIVVVIGARALEAERMFPLVTLAATKH